MYNETLFLVLNNLRAGDRVKLLVVSFFSTDLKRNLEYFRDAMDHTLSFHCVRSISIAHLRFT